MLHTPQATLINAYPVLYRKYTAGAHDTTGDHPRLATGTGWAPLLAQLSADLTALMARDGLDARDYAATCVRACPAGLDFQMTRTTAGMRALIRDAAERARGICGKCGQGIGGPAVAVVRYPAWETLCGGCVKESEAFLENERRLWSGEPGCLDGVMRLFTKSVGV